MEHYGEPVSDVVPTWMGTLHIIPVRHPSSEIIDLMGMSSSDSARIVSCSVVADLALLSCTLSLYLTVLFLVTNAD